MASYRKIQLFGPDEQALYTAGDAYVTFAFKGTRFGLLICYDAEFPEHVRHLAGLALPSHDKSGWQWIIRSAVVRAADRPGTRSDGLSTHWSGGFVHAT
ncbi:MAG: hypothetical protein OXH51_11870 [Gemmatimonadetes bacterium]|nr:hypothetical protein [Gemmatimonadota bacterium]